MAEMNISRRDGDKQGMCHHDDSTTASSSQQLHNDVMMDVMICCHDMLVCIAVGAA